MVINLLKRLTKEEGVCIIVVTHDLEIAAQADVVYHMKDGRIAIESLQTESQVPK